MDIELGVGDGDAFFVESFLDRFGHIKFDFKKVCRSDPQEQEIVHAAVGVFADMYLRRGVRAELWMLRRREDRRLDAVDVVVIGGGEGQVNAALSLDRVVIDAGGGGIAVRDIDALAVGGHDLRVAHTDLLDRAAVRADLHEIADAERVRGKQRNAAYHIGKGVLHRQRDRQGDDAQERDQRGHIDAETAGGDENDDRIQQHAHGRLQKGKYCFVKSGAAEHAVKELQQQLDHKDAHDQNQNHGQELLQRQRGEKVSDLFPTHCVSSVSEAGRRWESALTYAISSSPVMVSFCSK